MSEPELFRDRLDRVQADINEIKHAMEKVADAMATLIRVEERQAHQTQAIDRAFRAIEMASSSVAALADRIAALERAQPISQETNKWVERGLSALVGAVPACLILILSTIWKKVGL